MPNEGKTNSDSLERRSTLTEQIAGVYCPSNTMGGNGGGFDSQYALTEKKEVSANNNISTNKDNKKWSIGGLFRRKKKASGYGSTSDDDSAENGVATKRSAGKDKKGARKRTSKVGGFDHIVQIPAESYDRHMKGVQINTGSLERQRPQQPPHTRSIDDSQQHYSSEDELLLGIGSCNLGNISRFRSDDSLMTSQSTSSNRKSRAARTERYLKRRSRDGEGESPLIVGGPYNSYQSVDQHLNVAENRWKAQPIMFHGQPSKTHNQTYSSNYQQPKPNALHNQQPFSLQNSNSLSQMPQIVNFQMNYTIPPDHLQQQQQHPNSLHSGRINPEQRSFSYDNYINHYSLPKSSKKNYHHNPEQQQPQYANQAQVTPPPPPTRGPMRRFTVDTAQSRPISYAFDKHKEVEARGPKLGPRCVSDDHLWSQNGLMVHNSQLKQSPAHYSNMSMRSVSGQSKESPTQSRRRQTLSPGALDPSKQQAYKYVAEATPRSRKPIHVLGDQQQPQHALNNNYQSQRIKSQSATDFWKKIDHQLQQFPLEPTLDIVIKPKAVLTPRRSLDIDTKSNSLSRSYRFDVPVPKSCDTILKEMSGESCRFRPLNKYEEHISKKMSMNNLRSPITVAQQKKHGTPSSLTKSDQSLWTESRDPVESCVKTKNLEDAINELETIYKSLKLSDDDLLKKAERDIPTPTGFSKKVREYQYYDDDEDDVDGNGMRKEPDILLDDVAYRNLKHANNFPKVTDLQLPFGIPIGPISTPFAQDYLKVTPISSNASTSSMSPVAHERRRHAHRESPDLVSDDLAVRNLRRDNQQAWKSNQLLQPKSNQKISVRSQSANIYNLIQRDASRPSGGNLDDYNVFDALSKKLINHTDGDSDMTDVPVTVSSLCKKGNSRETRYKTISNFLQPNITNGAVFNLPSTLQQKPPIPTPRKSLSPYHTCDATSEPTSPEAKGINALNKLVMDARISSEKLSKDLYELRKERNVTNEAPLVKPIALSTEKSVDQVVPIGPPKSASLLNISPNKTSSETTIPQLPIVSSKSVNSDILQTSASNEELILPGEKVNLLVDKFNEREKVKLCEAPPVAVTKSPPVSAPKKSKSLSNKIKLLEDINGASKAVRACEQMLVDVVQDTPKNMLSDKMFLLDINEVSLAVKGCEQILKGVIPMDGSDGEDRVTDNSYLVTPAVVLDCELPISVRALKEAFEKELETNASTSPCFEEKKEGITNITDSVNMGDYDNLLEKVIATEDVGCSNLIPEGEIIVPRAIECKPEIQREIDEIMRACNEVSHDEHKLKNEEISKSCELLSQEESKSLGVDISPPYSTTVEDLTPTIRSSSMGPNNNYPKSSSLTSLHTFSSSDYLKSPSSDRGPISTADQCVKHNSTTSYDVKSTTASLSSEETLSPDMLKSSLIEDVNASEERQIVQLPIAFKTKQAPDADAECMADTTESSQYNSSEELAMIFGIKQPSVTPPKGNQVISFNEWSKLECAAEGDDEIDLEINNNNLFVTNQNDTESLVVNFKSAAPKLHGLRYFATKRNDLDIIFENPDENAVTYKDPDTEDLLNKSVPVYGDEDGDGDEVDCFDLKFTSEIVVQKDMSVCLIEHTESKLIGGNVESFVDKKLCINKIEIIVCGEGVSETGLEKESETKALRNDALVGELVVEEPVPERKMVGGETGAAGDWETSSNERGSDLESSSGNNKSKATAANKLNLPFSCGEGSRNRNREQNQNERENGKERPNLLHPEHFLFASMAYQGLSSYDDILTMLAILIALITLIALIFI